MWPVVSTQVSYGGAPVCELCRCTNSHTHTHTHKEWRDTYFLLLVNVLMFICHLQSKNINSFYYRLFYCQISLRLFLNRVKVFLHKDKYENVCVSVRSLRSVSSLMPRGVRWFRWSRSEGQKVLCRRQWQPQPVGHSSCWRNQSIMWLVCPPWPQLRQKLEEPRTATWQMAHWKVSRLQTAHCVPRVWLRQWQQYTPNSTGGGGRQNIHLNIHHKQLVFHSLDI